MSLIGLQEATATEKPQRSLPADAVTDYQLGGSYTPPSGVNIVVRDSTELPAVGLYNICYVNGFQTQPGDSWPKELLVLNPDDTPLVDPGWPDEQLLNISSKVQRTRILERLAATISRCAKAGYTAVEFDNLDSYTRSKGALKLNDAIAFATLLVKTAHDHGLAAGQKNTSELSARGKTQIGFDFVVSEECHRFDECAAYTLVYGDQVINVEYTDDLRGSFKDVCSDSQTPKDTVLRDRNLTPAGNSHYYFKHC
ncbi:endo alpha-1,4 polygalactosaminidase [Phyllobacterium sp. YR531]|uniref:endo alpha-1,4 polygalactosaminidase n=1 Tax=Phyllobacterium sp. YR531 TaxID=1144343 RepID=UPI0019309B11|nr:endo alpha-1,4 polygalactosaminidase [Phyllobacterium sp. YR531]